MLKINTKQSKDLLWKALTEPYIALKDRDCDNCKHCMLKIDKDPCSECSECSKCSKIFGDYLLWEPVPLH